MPSPTTPSGSSNAPAVSMEPHNKTANEMSFSPGQNRDANVKAQETREGPIARRIEEQTAKLPSDIFLWAALGSIGLSLALNLTGKKEQANFVGHWAPTILVLGMYNKLVKLHGSDRTDVKAH